MGRKIPIEIRDGVEGKVCTGRACGGIWQPLDEFYTEASTGRKLSRCKVCKLDSRYRRFHPNAEKSPLETRDRVAGKVCKGTVCGGIWKPLDEFPKGKHIGGRGPRCLVCYAEMKNQKRTRNSSTAKVTRGTTEIRDGVKGKVCTGKYCDRAWKPLEEFYLYHFQGKPKYTSNCKFCTKQAAKAKRSGLRKPVQIEIRDGVEGKRCTGPLCNREVWHPLTDFAKGSGAGGKRAICGDCKNTLERQRRQRKRASLSG